MFWSFCWAWAPAQQRLPRGLLSGWWKGSTRFLSAEMNQRILFSPEHFCQAIARVWHLFSRHAVQPNCAVSDS